METPQWLVHSYYVAELMYSISKAEGASENECQSMWLLGFLHDIGKRFSEENHNETGEEILKRNGYKKANTVGKHGKPLDDFNWALYYLNKSDMMTNQDGTYVTYEKRLKDITKRYGKDSKTYEDAKNVMELCEKYDSKKILPQYTIEDSSF